MGKSKDVELAAMNVCAKALEGLGEPTRTRVIRWLIEKFDGAVTHAQGLGIEHLQEFSLAIPVQIADGCLGC